MITVRPAATGLALADNVARAQFTSGISEREPVDESPGSPPSSSGSISSRRLRDLSGKTVPYRWIHAGEAMADVEFEVGGPRWRVE